MIWLFILSLFLAVANSGEMGLTVEVRPGKYECYFQSVTDEKHKQIEVDYQVIDGGDLNINFMLILGADILAQDTMKAEGTHKLDIKTMGDYQICFDNTFSYQARKVVFFEVYLMDANGNVDDDFNAGLLGKKDDIEFVKKVEEIGVTLIEFQAVTGRIKHILNKIEYYQSSMRSYEHRDFAIIYANLNRISFWSSIFTVTLLLVSVVQVYTIRSLFEQNSKIGKALRR